MTGNYLNLRCTARPHKARLLLLKAAPLSAFTERDSARRIHTVPETSQTG